MYDRIQTMIHNQQEYSKSNAAPKVQTPAAININKPYLSMGGLSSKQLVMAEVNAEVKARSLSNQFGLHLSTADSINEQEDTTEAPKFFRMRASSGGL